MNKVMKSFSWALNGLQTAWREEVNFRIELFVAVVVIALGATVRLYVFEWMVIVGCIGAVLAAEILNTAIEDLCNKVEPGIDPAIGKIKDLMGAFVLVVCVVAGIIGVFVFANHL